jgi:hypothetical protein
MTASRDADRLSWLKSDHGGLDRRRPAVILAYSRLVDQLLLGVGRQNLRALVHHRLLTPLPTTANNSSLIYQHWQRSLAATTGVC